MNTTNPLYVPASASPKISAEAALVEAMRRTNGHEGGFANVKHDVGGKTAVGGLTEALARQYGYTGRMEDMTLEQSLKIIVSHCWDKEGLAALAGQAPYLAIAVYDCNVNFGPGRAGMWVQQALNALNFTPDDGTAPIYGADLKPDGKIGPATRMRILQVLKQRGAEAEDWLIAAVVANRMVHHITRCNEVPTQRKFAAGWMDRIVNSAGEF